MANQKRPEERAEAELAEIEARIDLNPELNEADREYIKTKAREHVQTKLREQSEKAKDALISRELKRAIIDAEKDWGIHGAMIDIHVDLPPNCLYIMLDGQSFWHGQTYEVSENVARTLDDIMARAYEHDNEIHGQPRRADRGRRPRQANIGAHRTTIPGLYNNSGAVNRSNLPQV